MAILTRIVEHPVLRWMKREVVIELEVNGLIFVRRCKDGEEPVAVLTEIDRELERGRR